MSLGGRAARIYLIVLGTAFLLFAPFFLRGGGYTRIMDFKAAAWLVLSGLFLLVSLFDLRDLKGYFRGTERRLAWGYLFFCLLSAAVSPWPGTAFLGGSRAEGFLHLALYVLSFLLLSRASFPRKGLLCAFAAALLAEDLLCLLQMRGYDPLGLFPEGLGWADANIRYVGSYLGTLGNTGQTGAVLAAASALFYLSILEKGGRYYLLLPILILSVLVLAMMDVTAPMLALGLVMLLAVFPYGGTMEGLCRWGGLSALTGAFLIWHPLGDLGSPAALGLTGLSGLCFLLGRLLPGKVRTRSLSLLLLAALLILALWLPQAYESWYGPMQDASTLFRSGLRDDMGGGRIYIWRQVLSAAAERPLLGSGPDTLGLRGLDPYDYFSEETGLRMTLGIDAAHCEYLHTLVCCGLPAALCHLALAVCALMGFFRRRGAGRSCAGAALCYGIQAFFGISMCAAAPVFWVFLALSLTEGGANPEPDEQK